MKKLILTVVVLFGLTACSDKNWIQRVDINKLERGTKAYAICGQSDDEKYLEAQINEELNKRGYFGKDDLLIKCSVIQNDNMAESTTKSFVYNSKGILLANFEAYNLHYDFRSQRGLGANAKNISDYVIYKFLKMNEVDKAKKQEQKNKKYLKPKTKA